MYLKTIHLRHFRNYQDQQVEFLAPKTILVGDNAQGKSNLLEAVELLATLRSHRVSRDRDLVQDGEAIGQITASVERELGPVEMALALRSNGRRTAALNGETLRRQFDFLGTLNAVQFSSLDLELVRGGPEKRRHWLDALVTQLEPVYAHILQQYQQILRQRNALLKSELKQRTGNGVLSELDADDSALAQLALWDSQLVTAGTRVIRRRTRALARLVPLAASWHRVISGSTENLEIRYVPNVRPEGLPILDQVENSSDSQPGKPDLRDRPDRPEQIQQAFWEKIRRRAAIEQYQGTTLVGPHRDDVEFLINQTPARQYGSQGQQRTLVLALKLAELKLIEEIVGEPPLLLLDDVLAELDLHRQNQLLDTIQDRFQTLITTTHLGSFDAQWLKSSQILAVKAGQIEEEIAF
ncbi:MAG: DNA replication/repair protein RecF [Leptolyngbyaceae cyanobacterium bins.59]|nr:DNA replication/repair protein RecF [Leptolyngbyaceae cyanobacterium bins.59]